MKIGELAAATDTPVETIRYYEREGLLPTPARTAGNYRVYGSPQAQRLAFIRRCRALDMTLDEVRRLLAFVDSPGPDCADVNRLLDEHLRHVRQRMVELKRLDRELRQLRQQCQAQGPASDCGILRQLRATPEASAEAATTERACLRHGDLHRPRRNAARSDPDPCDTRRP